MSGNLRDRLRRIQQAQQGGDEARSRNTAPASDQMPFFEQNGWTQAGYLTLRREITCGKGIVLPRAIPEAAGIVMPGLDSTITYEDLLFFDLETTGLSGGAGTVAFLAAFGRLARTGTAGAKTALFDVRVTQFLLLDYPGESDFVEALLGEFRRSPNRDGLTMVSYNGRCFDSQILTTRCLMKGLSPPQYRHADLLYPARRLWKRLLPNCSQATIETHVLGIDRTGDIPGAMAPDIWFSFLKNGDAEPLLGICDHNRRDIEGLAAIFSTMAHIADDPFTAIEKVDVDLEMLALRWYFWVGTRDWGLGVGDRGIKKPLTEARRHGDTRRWDQGRRLLALAAERGGHRAGLHYALMLLGAGKHDEGREWLCRVAGEDSPLSIRAAALRALAIDSEHRLKDAAGALEWAKQALELLPLDSAQRLEFEHRIQRLQKKQLTK